MDVKGIGRSSAAGNEPALRERDFLSPSFSHCTRNQNHAERLCPNFSRQFRQISEDFYPTLHRWSHLFSRPCDLGLFNLMYPSGHHLPLLTGSEPCRTQIQMISTLSGKKMNSPVVSISYKKSRRSCHPNDSIKSWQCWSHAVDESVLRFFWMGKYTILHQRRLISISGD